MEIKSSILFSLPISSITYKFYITGFIIIILLETPEKGEPPPSGLGSPTLLKYIIKLSLILSSIDSISLVLLIVIFDIRI